MEQKLKTILEKADIEIGGSKPGDIQIHDKKFFSRVAKGGSLGLGEAYIDKQWDCEHLDVFFSKILTHLKNRALIEFLPLIIPVIKTHLFNLQTKGRAKIVGEKHYNLGNDLFELMLDPLLIYSCGYWKNATNLEKAQEEKLDLIFKKLDLKAGMKVLDIGCGWGGAAKFAADKYGVNVVGVTISTEQAKYARRFTENSSVEIRVQDYRAINEKFDRVYSIGMFEHVGVRNYETYMKKVREVLKPDGIFLLHTIGGNRTTLGVNPWIEKYIFPNGKIPSPKQISKSFENVFVMEDWHNFGPDYDKTLMAWHENFKNNWDKLKDTYDERFFRIWSYYLLSCAGSFRARNLQLWQLVLTPANTTRSRYDAPR